MKIVIDIPENVKKAFDNANKDDIYGCFYDYNSVIGNAIKNGIVLPKGHGALKDADKLAIAIAMIRDRWDCYGNEYESAMYQAYDNSVDEIIDALTIIEADEVDK